MERNFLSKVIPATALVFLVILISIFLGFIGGTQNPLQTSLVNFISTGLVFSHFILFSLIGIVFYSLFLNFHDKIIKIPSKIFEKIPSIYFQKFSNYLGMPIFIGVLIWYGATIIPLNVIAPTGLVSEGGISVQLLEILFISLLFLFRFFSKVNFTRLSGIFFELMITLIVLGFVVAFVKGNLIDIPKDVVLSQHFVLFGALFDYLILELDIFNVMLFFRNLNGKKPVIESNSDAEKKEIKNTGKIG